ncbi:class I SAM-dependent methyltransferase [Kribbella sp. CA-253562]|uniref:class I SAM-dependent methyltransferase n=1 Tax=Kribbella sp. CA-253562 TaxID=3239942 RepID=UPI003D9112B7
MTKPSEHAVAQYSVSGERLTARMAVHAFGTNPRGWFSWLGERLAVRGDVLEVGAGTGRLWSEVPYDGARLTLTDASAAMCAELRRVPGAVVRRADAADLPFAGESFDLVIANHMLYHVDDPSAALAEFARVLRPGGRLVAAVNGREHMADLRELGPAIGRADLLRGLVVNDVVTETVEALVAEHFADVVLEHYPDDLHVPTVEPVLGYLNSLTDRPLSAAEEATVRRLVQARIDAEGYYFVRKRVGLVTARR